MKAKDTVLMRLQAGAVADGRRPLKKSVDTLAIVPTKDRISILARKVYNVMMHFAQEQGPEQQIYRVRLRDVINGIDFNSKNTDVIKDHLRQMVTTKVEWQSPTKGEGAKWAVSALIAHAELINEGGEVFMEWSYAVNIKHEILDPQRYARISLAFQAEFRSMPGLALYEICSRYIDNPGGLTARQHWTWWRPVLTGAPESQVGIYSEWKYFKRDVIKGAVAEVNQITDLEIEAIEHRSTGRSIGDLQFRIRRKEQKKLPFGTAPTPVNLRDIGRAINLGVQQDKAEKLLAKFDEAVFGQALDALESRFNRKDLGEVRTPDKYLAVTLSEIVKNNRHTKQIVIDTAKVKSHVSSERIAIIEKFRDSRRQLANELYKELPSTEQSVLLAVFEADILPVIGVAVTETYQKRGLSAPMTRSHFTKYLAEHFFGKDWAIPSDAELLDFTISGGVAV
jgi:hypothetical protein